MMAKERFDALGINDIIAYCTSINRGKDIIHVDALVILPSNHHKKEKKKHHDD